ncbi:unnamed protein product, partial [Arabidopsis halleri]
AFFATKSKVVWKQRRESVHENLDAASTGEFLTSIMFDLMFDILCSNVLVIRQKIKSDVLGQFFRKVDVLISFHDLLYVLIYLCVCYNIQ